MFMHLTLTYNHQYEYDLTEDTEAIFIKRYICCRAWMLGFDMK